MWGLPLTAGTVRTVEVTVADQDRGHIRVVGDAAAGAFELTWVTS